MTAFHIMLEAGTLRLHNGTEITDVPLTKGQAVGKWTRDGRQSGAGYFQCERQARPCPPVPR